MVADDGRSSFPLSVAPKRRGIFCSNGLLTVLQLKAVFVFQKLHVNARVAKFDKELFLICTMHIIFATHAIISLPHTLIKSLNYNKFCCMLLIYLHNHLSRTFCTLSILTHFKLQIRQTILTCQLCCGTISIFSFR